MCMAIGKVIGEFNHMEEIKAPRDRLIGKAMARCHENQVQHILMGCLKDPPLAQLFVTYGSRDQYTLICRGTSHGERYHMHQNNHSQGMAIVAAELMLFYLGYEWNIRKLLLFSDTFVDYYTNDFHSLHVIHSLHSCLVAKIQALEGHGVKLLVKGTKEDALLNKVYEAFVTEESLQTTHPLFGYSMHQTAGIDGHYHTHCRSSLQLQPGIPSDLVRPPGLVVLPVESNDALTESDSQHALISSAAFLKSLVLLPPPATTKWSMDEYRLFISLIEDLTKEGEEIGVDELDIEVVAHAWKTQVQLKQGKLRPCKTRVWKIEDKSVSTWNAFQVAPFVTIHLITCACVCVCVCQK